MFENIRCKKRSFQMALSVMLQLFVRHAGRDVTRPDGQCDRECLGSTSALILQTAVLCVKGELSGMLAQAEQKCRHPNPLEENSSSLPFC